MEPQEQNTQGQSPQEQQPNPSQNPSNSQAPYPGFGQRHDIFYQYEPPDPATAPPPPPARAEIPQYPPQLDTEQEYYEEPESGGRKKILIIAAAVLTLLIIGGVVLALTHSKKPKAPAASSNTSQNQGTAQNPDLVNTPCFEFTLPAPHDTLSPTITSCSGSYLSGADKQAGVTISPVISPFTSIDDIVTSWKSNNPSQQIVKENPATFGNYQAYQVQWNSSNSPSETEMTVLVYTPPTNGVSRYISDQGASIFGFEIDGRYDSQSSSKSIYDSILSSWQWK